MELTYILASLILMVSLLNFFKTSNLLMMLISIELILNAANIILIQTALKTSSAEILVWFITIISVVAAEAGIGFAIIILLSRRFGLADIRFIRKIKEYFR